MYVSSVLCLFSQKKVSGLTVPPGLGGGIVSNESPCDRTWSMVDKENNKTVIGWSGVQCGASLIDVNVTFLVRGITVYSCNMGARFT